MGCPHLRDIFFGMGFDDYSSQRSSFRWICHTDRSGLDGPWTEDPKDFRFKTARIRQLNRQPI